MNTRVAQKVGLVGPEPHPILQMFIKYTSYVNANPEIIYTLIEQLVLEKFIQNIFKMTQTKSLV